MSEKLVTDEEELMNHYLESIGLFYDEKIKFLSMKDNYISCKGCPQEKKFLENYEEVTLSCGSKEDDTKCGLKINIKFAKYLHYSSHIQKLKDELEELINYDVIQNYINVSSERNKQNIKESNIDQKIKEITDRFYKMNVESKKEKIHTFYKNRIKNTKRCREILKKLNTIDIDDSTKSSFRKEYVSLITIMNNEYQEIITLINDFNSYLQIKEPSVIIKIKEEDELENKVKNKSEKNNITKKAFIGILKVMYSINKMNPINLQDIYPKIPELREITGLFKGIEPENNIRHRITGEGGNNMMDHGYIIRVGRGVYQITEKGKQFLDGGGKVKKIKKKGKKKKDITPLFTKGDDIFWIKGNEIIEGNINKNTSKNVKLINVIDNDGKEYYVPKEEIHKGTHEPEPEPEINEQSSPPKDTIPPKQKKHIYSKDDWLSTYHVGIPFKFNGVEYPSVENAFNAHKINDDDPRAQIYRNIFSTYNYKTLSPKEAQEMGKKLFEPGENNYLLRRDWDEIKLKLMKDIIREYYISNPEQLYKLINTDDKELIYLDKKTNSYWVEKSNKGQNNHGKILMELRE